jgi:PEP-CTERM motif
LVVRPDEDSDAFQHVYSLTVAAGDAYVGSPAGTFVSWEDRGPGGDWDYNDDAFIFTGVTPSVASGVPEPSTWAMMFLGFAGLGYAAFRRSTGKSQLEGVTA